MGEGGRMERIISVYKAMMPVVRALARLLWTMIFVSGASLWVGVEEAQERIAKEWEEQAIRWGWPNLEDSWLPTIVSTLALVVILVCWIITAEITVLLLRLIF